MLSIVYFLATHRHPTEPKALHRLEDLVGHVLPGVVERVELEGGSVRGVEAGVAVAVPPALVWPWPRLAASWTLL